MKVKGAGKETMNTSVEYTTVLSVGQSSSGNEKKSTKYKRRRNEPPSTEQAERSRAASKARRDKEQAELDQLTALLPFNRHHLDKVDKVTIIKLALSFIQTKQFLAEALKDITENVETMSLSAQDTESAAKMKAEEGRLMMEALDGFLIFVGKNGRVGFVSEQVEKHLGLTSMELMSMSVLDLVHNEDQREFLQQFEEDASLSTTSHRNITSLLDFSETEDKSGVQNAQRERVFYVRIKCHLAKPGNKTKQHGHLLTQWSGRLQCRVPPQGGDAVPVGLVAIVRPVHSDPIVEIRLDGNMFISRHDLGLRFTFCDPRILNLIGYDPDELMGKSTYQFNYPTDALKIQNCHSHLIAKGTCVSKYYRFLGKNGQWVWMKTRATIIYNADNEPQYVVCLNYVYSEEEGKRCLLLEGENNGASFSNVQGYIDIKSLGSKELGVYSKHPAEPNNNYQVPGFHTGILPAGQEVLSGSLILGQPSGNSDASVAVPVSEAVLDHTYPITSVSAVTNCGDLPAGLAASGFPQFVQQNFLDNATTALPDTDWTSWLDGLTSTLTLDATADINGLNLNDTMASTTMVNRDYRLAVSDHDYSAKPESIQDNHSNRNDSVFSNSEGLLLEGLDEMMDTDFLDTVSFGRTNYDDSQVNNGLLNGEGLLGSILSKSGFSLSDDLGDTNSLLEAIGQNGLQDSGLPVTDFTSNHVSSMDGIMSSSDSFAAKFAQSLIDEEVKGGSYSLGKTDPCLGVTSLQHLTTSKTTHIKNGIKNSGLEQNLNQHTLGLVDTPPPSPKPVRHGGKPAYLSLHHTKKASSKHSSPSHSPPITNLSASFSGSSQKASSSSSPPHSRSLSKSWPNSGKPRNRSSGSSSGSSRHRSTGSHHSRSGSSRSDHKNRPTPSLLEQFLTTKQRINPNKGSDHVFQKSRATERISKPEIYKDVGEDPNLLQQLLTGEIDGKRVHQYEQRVIKTRRHDSENNTPVTSPLTSPLVSDIELDSESLATDSASLDLFDSGAADMGNFFEPLSPDVDVLLHSDLDDILREQSRQEELWLRQYVS